MTGDATVLSGFDCDVSTPTNVWMCLSVKAKLIYVDKNIETYIKKYWHFRLFE